MAKMNIPGWKIKETLGTGGQAHVFLAEKEPATDGQQYALKVLKNNNEDSQAYGRFCREIVALKKLEHPNIVGVIEHAPEGSTGNLYYVMNYVPGAKSLKALIKEKTNPYKHNELAACQLFIQLASALEACKSANIIHRDLSPANVLVLPDSRIKIIDFGICEMGGSERVTQTDENFGTLNYRAPECAPHSGTPFTITTDLYSAGKIVWSAMTDRQVFEREKPVFGACSMRDMFPDHPNRWHLQRLFERTIRLAPVNRFPNGTEARIFAEQIYNMMATHVLPIEQLLYHCPVCRMGKLVAAEKVVSRGSYLIFGNTQAEGVASYACDNCGYCYRICYERLNKTIKACREME